MLSCLQTGTTNTDVAKKETTSCSSRFIIPPAIIAGAVHCCKRHLLRVCLRRRVLAPVPRIADGRLKKPPPISNLFAVLEKEAKLE